MNTNTKCNPINLANANAVCNTLTAQNLVETTAKEFAQICINKHLLQQSYTPQQLSDLKTIAELCPYTHGYAVYLARTVLAEFDTVFVEYLNICEEYNEENMGRFANENNQEQEENLLMHNEKWRIYPVPTSYELYVETNGDIYVNTKLTLYNMLGEIMFEKNISENVNQIKILDFPVGIYYVTIYENGSIAYNGKVVVVR